MSELPQPYNYAPDRSERRRMVMFWVSLGTIVATAAVVAIIVALRPAADSGRLAAPPPPAGSAAAPATGSAAQSRHAPTGHRSVKPVVAHPGPKRRITVSSLENDGATYGVGMPLVFFMSPAPHDPTSFEKAVKVRVDGQVVQGAWYWEQPTREEKSAHIVEAHFRMPNFWPEDSQVHVTIPIAGLSAGKNLVYSNKLTKSMFGKPCTAAPL